MGIVALDRKASVYMFAILLLILVSLSLTHASSPNIMNVETINVPDDYQKIQWAIDNASAGDTILVASGTYYENVVITKPVTLKGAGSDITIIDGGGTRAGVKIPADNVSISGFTIRNSGDGIHLYLCNGVIVSDNKITSNKYDGIYAQNVSGNIIRDNTITSNGFGGLFTEYSSDNTVSDNVITSNAYDGVYLYYSSNNTVNGNTITSHINWPAISLEWSDGNTVNNNMLSSNELGISLIEGSNGNTIVGNTILNSGYVGVSLFYSSGNSFYHNNFINNTDQVYPSGTNAWDDGVEGNYWSDYNGTGPYVIDASNKDNHPLINPYDKTKPIADAGSDQLIVKGTTVTFDGHDSTDNLDSLGYGIVNYTWSFADAGQQILTGVQANYTFNNTDNFCVTLNVSDYSGNWDTDELWVNVTWTATVRDIAIANITVSPTTMTTGDTVLIEVIVVNKGDFSENFPVTVYYDSSVVGEKNVTSLASGTNETLSFNWNTMGVPGGDYAIEVVATIVDGETNTTDNTRTYGTVTIMKLTSIISISAFPANITVGDSIILNGSISPLRVEANVTINYRFLGETWNTLTILTTDTDGHYSYNWTPATIGTYEVKAGWEGDDNTLADKSNVWNVTVKEGEAPPTEEKTATNLYPYVATVAIIIIASATTVYVLKVRKRKPTHEAREQESPKNFTSACKS